VASVWSADIVTAQVTPAAVQAPDQAVVTIPAGGVPVKVTAVPASNVALQVPELEVHAEIPAGEEFTAPDPVTVRASVYKDTKLAPADWSADIVSAQVAPAAAQAPDQTVLTGPLVGVTDKVTAVPEGKDALQMFETQEMPLGLDVTVAAPLAVNVSVKLVGATPLNATFAVLSADIVTVHVPVVPELAQAPPQPDTTFAAVGVAVRVTDVSAGKDPVQVLALQEMPLGLEGTVPAPVADIVRVKLDAGAVGVVPLSCSVPEEPHAETAIARITVASLVRRNEDHLRTRALTSQMIRMQAAVETFSILPPECLMSGEYYTRLLLVSHDRYIGRPTASPIPHPAGPGDRIGSVGNGGPTKRLKSIRLILS